MVQSVKSAVMKVVIIAVIGWACHSVAAQEKVCTASCNSLGMLRTNPGKSCNDIYQINKASRGVSGNYWINTTTGVHQVYCNMELECGGHKGGWMRIADLDTSRGDDCPSGWNKITTPIAACIADSSAGCYSTNSTTFGVPYSKVCGMAVGYQKGRPDGFYGYQFSTRSINGPYVDGISITYGIPRKHIWTYAIGISDKTGVYHLTSHCPCSENIGRLPPSFVHDNYYCESGTMLERIAVGSTYFTDDPVWDGDGCSSGNSCCFEPSMPWFYRQIPLTASEDIEARICHDETSNDEDVVIRELQLYVQ